jgi:hypothetical protein
MNAAYLVGTGFEDITVAVDGDQIIEDTAHSDWDAYPALNLNVCRGIFSVALSTYRSCDGLILRRRNPAAGA